jgi:hypothetical protein
MHLHPLPRRLRHHLLATAAASLLAGLAPAQAQTYSFSNGVYTPGVTGPATLGPSELLQIVAGGFKYFDTASGVFTNLGTVQWQADILYLAGSAQVLNQGLWDAQSDQILAFNGGSPSFVNTGTFRKSGGSGSTTINAGTGFVNRGVLEAQTGTINFVGGSRFEAGSVFTGAGVNLVSAGNNSFSGTLTSSNLVLGGGTHTGSAAVLMGDVAFRGGALAGSWEVAAGQGLNLQAGGFKYIDGATVANAGTVRWQADALYLQNGAQVNNTGLWEASSDQALLYNGGATPTFNNTGTFRKSGGTGNTTIGAGAGFVNSGTVEARTGTVYFAGGSRFNAGSVFTGAGRVVAADGANTFSGAFTSDNLVLQSGTHVGEGAVVQGRVVFTGGTVVGGWTVGTGHTLSGQAGSFKYLQGSLTNQGTVSWDSGDALYFQNGGQLVNQGLFVATASTQLVYNGGAQPTFENQASGTLRAAAGTTLTVGNMLVNNGGLLQADAGAAVRYTGGAQFNDGSRFEGDGSHLAVGANRFAGAQRGTRLELQSGVHTADGAVIAGQVRFSGGELVGSWQVAAGHGLDGADGSFKYLRGNGTVLHNLGTVAWNTGNALYMQDGARLVNDGLFVANTSSLLLSNGGARPAFENNVGGRLRAAAGVVLTVGDVLVNNGGTLDAQAGGVLRYTGGAVFNDGTQFTGAGSHESVGNNRFVGAYTAVGLVLQSGVHTGEGAVANGTTSFSGGTLTGTWQVASGQTVTGRDGGFKYLDGAGTVLDNRGTLAWTTGNALYLQNAAVLANAGTLDLQADTAVLYNGGATPTLLNTGLIVKSGGSGTATIGNGVAFDNLGTVDVRSGTLALPTNFTNRGVLTGTGSYAVAGTLNNAGTVAPGASPGTLALAGSYAQAAAGTLAIELTSLASHDLFTIIGTAALDGTLALSCFADCSFAVGDTFTILDAVGELSGSFASVTLSGFATGAFNVVYDTGTDRVLLQVTETVTAVPEPGTWALWLAGLAGLGQVVRRRGVRR